MKFCNGKDCKIDHEDDQFSPSELKKNWARCRKAMANKRREYREKNAAQISQSQKKYRILHKEEISEYDRKRYEENKKEVLARAKINHDNLNDEERAEIARYKREWCEENKDEISVKRKTKRDNRTQEQKIKDAIYQIQYQQDPKNKERRNKKSAIRRENDPSFRLRNNIATSIRNAIKKGGSKKSGSIIDHLPQPINDIIAHLASLFSHPNSLAPSGEEWMTWDNYGEYEVATWNDDDVSTWRWSIDHKIPQADLPYASMEDGNFKKCWALENLRPYSAKQNVIDGAAKIRHKKDDK